MVLCSSCMKDWCVRCDKKREGDYDEDTDWFVCNKCYEIRERHLAYEEEQEHKSFNQLHPEVQAEIRFEYAMDGVDFPY